MNARLQQLREQAAAIVELAADRWAAMDADRQRQARLALIVLAVALPLLLFVLPLTKGRLAAHAELHAATAQWEEVRMLERRILELGLHEGGRAEPVPTGGDSLLSVVDAAARKAEIATRVQSMRPVSGRGRDDAGGVEVQLQGLVYEELLRFLFQIEKQEPILHVRRIEVQKDAREPRQLRASLEVSP